MPFLSVAAMVVLLTVAVRVALNVSMATFQHTITSPAAWVPGIGRMPPPVDAANDVPTSHLQRRNAPHQLSPRNPLENKFPTIGLDASFAAWKFDVNEFSERIAGYAPRDVGIQNVVGHAQRLMDEARINFTLDIGGSAAKGTSVRTCSDYDYEIYTEEPAHRALRKVLSDAIGRNIDVTKAMIGKKAIAVTLNSGAKVDLVLMNTAFKSGIMDVKYPLFMGTRSRKEANGIMRRFFNDAPVAGAVVRCLKWIFGRHRMPSFLLEHYVRHIWNEGNSWTVTTLLDSVLGDIMQNASRHLDLLVDESREIGKECFRDMRGAVDKMVKLVQQGWRPEWFDLAKYESGRQCLQEPFKPDCGSDS